MTGPIIGVDVGGTFTKLVVLGPDGALLERSRIPTDDSAARRLPVEVAVVLDLVGGGLGVDHAAAPRLSATAVMRSRAAGGVTALPASRTRSRRVPDQR